MARPQSPTHRLPATRQLHSLPAPSRLEKLLLGLTAGLLAAWIVFLVTLAQFA